MSDKEELLIEKFKAANENEKNVWSNTVTSSHSYSVPMTGASPYTVPPSTYTPTYTTPPTYTTFPNPATNPTTSIIQCGEELGTLLYILDVEPTEPPLLPGGIYFTYEGKYYGLVPLLKQHVILMAKAAVMANELLESK
jgi:hypothetical protein